MGELQVWGDGVTGTAIGADVWNVRTVVACDWSGGRLLAFAAESGALDVWGDGYSQPEGISVEGDSALVTERTGNLLLQDLTTPGRAAATVLAGGLGAPHQVVRTDDGAAALVADHAGGRVVRIDLTNGVVDEVVTGLAQPVGLAAGASGELYVAEQGTGFLTRVDPDGSRSAVLTGLVSPFLLSWADGGRTSLLVTERAPAHRVGVVDLTAAAPAMDRLLGRGIAQPSQAIVVGDRLVVTGSGRLLSLDASAGLTGGVRVSAPEGPLWPGGWADVELDTGLTGYTRAEIEVAVEPAGVATVSEHPASGADPVRPMVRLLAGGDAGDAAVVVRDAVTKAELGRGPVAVGCSDDSPADGPPLWVDSPALAPPMRTLSLTKGINDAGSLRPTDSAGAPLPAWRVLAVLVDTGDATWPTSVSPTTPAPTVADAKSTWRDVLVGAGGVDTFYRELSGGRLGVSLVNGAVQGPVSLGKSWTDWFDQDKASKQWIAKEDVLTRVVAALQNKGIDWTKVDAVFMVVRTAAGGKYVWPRAGSRVYSQKVKTPAGKDADVLVARVAMPHDQTTAPKLGFTNVEVTAHELGHTVGLDDLYMDSGYTDQMKKRALGTRELMGNESGLPHLTARHKLLLGFLDPGHVRRFSYDVDADETFDLHPIAAGLPPAGRSAAVELAVAPKVSWFFELRQAVAGKLGDGSAFAGGQVMGYDAWTYKDPPVSANARRPIILLLDDGDGEGPVIVAGQDYEVLDTDHPSHLSAFRLEVVSVGAGVARVRVVVRRVKQPDPSIRNGGPSDYKSPDIEIRNELSDKDPAWLNKPVIGVNRVVAKVTNVGDLPAPNVVVRFKALPFNTDDPDSERWQDLGEPVKHDIPAGKTVEFETQWAPTGNRHHCVQARIDRYTRIPGAAADEPDVDNNLAQSNYFEIFSKPSSPATREVGHVDVHNPFDHAVSATVELRQDVAGYRSYVDHRWLRLEPGETRTVRVEVESLATSIWDAVEREYPDGRTWLRTWLEAPGLGDTARTGSGVSLGVSTAVETTVRVRESGPRWLLVQVESPAGAPPPHDGSVALQVDYEDGGRDVLVAQVQGAGQAVFEPRPVAGRGTLSFSGTRGYAPVDAVEVEVEGA